MSDLLFDELIAKLRSIETTLMDACVGITALDLVHSQTLAKSMRALDQVQDIIKNLHTANPTKLRSWGESATNKYTWWLSVSVDAQWVADGIDFTDSRVSDIFLATYGHLRSDELTAHVLRRPDDEAVAKEQGYATVEKYRTERDKP